MNLLFLWRFAVASSLAFLGTACSPHEPHASQGNGASQLPAATVSTERAVRQAHQATEEVVGTVRAKQRAIIESKVSGRVKSYLAAPGQIVKAGELLAELDVEEIGARLNQAQAALEQADKELARHERLISTNAISQQEFDVVSSRQKVAKATYQEAATMAGYTRVTAPFDGVITRKLADVGDLAMPGKPLMEVESPSALRFEAGVPEAILDRIQLGAKMTVTLSSLRQSLEGTVSEVTPVADPSSRTFPVKWDLPTREGLRTGQFGRVSIPVAEIELLTVPQTAVIKRGQMEIVWVVAEGRAILRLIRTGKTLGDRVEVLSGLEPGEEVITDGVAEITEGQAITVRK